MLLVEVHLALGTRCANRGDHVEALKHFERAYAIKPSSVPTRALYGLFSSQLALGQLSNARLSYKKALSLSFENDKSAVSGEIANPLVDDGFKFNYIISLGADCAVASSTKRTKRGCHSVFDWLITPHESVSKVIDDEGANIAKDAQIKRHRNGETFATGSQYGALYLHEFPTLPNGIIFISDYSRSAANARLRHKMSVRLM